jgi:dephospho-CoA kinase
MKKLLILIVGMPGSGKSFAASIIRKHFHAKDFKTGDVIREEIRRRGLKYNPENDKKMRIWFHSGREHLIVERLWKKVRLCKGIVVIDGLRSPKEVALLKKLYKGKIVLIKIKSSFNVRARRSVKRARFGKLETEKYLRERDKSEMSGLVGLKQLLKSADYTIDNSKLTKKQMEKKVVELAESIVENAT